MKKLLAVMLAFGVSIAYAEDKKKPTKAKPAAKSEKNAAQKAEASIGQWAHDNKIWMRGSTKK